MLLHHSPFSLFRNFSSFFFCTFTGQLVPPFIISINDLRVYLSPLEPMNRRFALGTQMQIENNTGLKFIGESVIPSKEREFNKLRLNARERHGREKVRKQGNVRSRCGSKSCINSLFGFILFRVVYSPAKYPRDISYLVRRGITECTTHSSPLSPDRESGGIYHSNFFFFFYYSIPFFSPRVPPRRYISYGLSYLTNSRAFKFQMYPVHQKISTMNR